MPSPAASAPPRQRPPIHNSKFIILTFSTGLLLGASAAWLATRPSSSDSDQLATRSSPPADMRLPAWDWRASPAPAALPRDTAASAIAAWLDLRADDGSPAAFPARADALRALLARLPSDAFPRLLTPLSGHSSPEDRRLLQAAFDIWVERDPAAAARWAGALAEAPGLDPARLARQAAREWAKTDAPAAAEWACSLPDKQRAADLARHILPILAEKDPARALALAAVFDGDLATSVLASLMEPLAKTDPAAALQTYGPRLWKNGDGFWSLRETIVKWAARDPAAAISWILAQPRRNDSEVSSWLGNLTQGNDSQHAAIATALATVPGIPNRQNSLGHLLFSWGAEKPDEALAWLQTLPDPDLRTILLERAARITYSERPERSLPLALAMAEGANRTERISDLLGQWAKKDPTAALAWMREHDDPGVAAAASAAQASILATIARDEPQTALAEWAALPDDATKTAARIPIAEAWSQTDPGAALQWLVAQESAHQAWSTHDRLAYSWAQKDPLAALRWAEALPADHLRHSYLSALAGTWQGKADRAATADLYTQIKDPATRLAVLHNHVAEWRTKDPAGAKAWVEKTSALTPEQAALLLEKQ